MSFSLPHELGGRYRLIRPLGEGGFAETYLAIDQARDRLVAVKVLRAQLAGDRDMAARFAREARATAAIQHPNVVAVFDHGEADGCLFTVMEFVDGSDLKQEIRASGIFAVDEALRIIDGVLSGLDAIHGAGIVHRDVKPENILISSTGTPKLSDFGIARTTTSTGLTATGITLGTASYMAPEQATGEALGPPIDLYAAGVVLFEMLTGQVPFPGDNPLQIMFQHVHQSPPRPAALNPDIPPALSAVILRALAKDPARRFQAAAGMQQALAASLTVEAPATTAFVPVAAAGPARAVRPANTALQRQPIAAAAMRWPVAALGAVVLLVLTTVVMLVSRDGGTAAVNEATSVESLAVLTLPLANIEPTPTATVAPSPTPTAPAAPTPTLQPAPALASEPTPTAEATQTATEEPASPTENQPTAAASEEATPQPVQQQIVAVEPTPAPAPAPPSASEQQILPATTSSSAPVLAEPDDERDKPQKDEKEKDDKSGKNQGDGNQEQGQGQGNKKKGKDKD